MAKYGVDPYFGTQADIPSTFYGEVLGPYISVDFFRAFIVNEFTNFGDPLFGTLKIEWTKPKGDLTGMRLVRNYTDIPVDENDGTILLDTDIDDSPRATDNQVVPGRFIYYALFVFNGTAWLKVASLTALPPADFGYGSRLLSLLPEYLRVLDATLVNPRLFFANRGPLERMLELVGWDMSQERSTYESLLLAHDPFNCAAGLLPLLAQMVGIEYEAELGTRLARHQIQDAVHSYKVKGTIVGVEGFITALTGWGAIVKPPKNRRLVPDSPSSPFLANGFGNIHSLSLVTSHDFATPTVLTAGPGGNSEFVIQATFDTVTDLTGFNFNSTRDITKMLPVTPGKTFVFSFYAQAGNSITDGDTIISLSVNFNYYSDTGQFIGTRAGSSTGTLTHDGWVRNVSVQTPVSQFVSPQVIIDNFANTDVLYIAETQVEDGTVATTFDPPRDISITLLADRVNKIDNATFELGVAHWTADANTTLEQSLAHADTGTKSAKLTSLGTGNMTITSDPMPVTPLSIYALSGSFLEPTDIVGNRCLVHWSIRWLDQSLAAIGPDLVGGAVNEAAGYVRASVVGQAPAGSVFASAIATVLSVTGASKVHNVDSIMFERSTVVNPFLLADGSGNFFWQNGVPNDSPLHFYARRSIKQSRLLARMPEYLPAGRTFSLLFAQPIA